MRLQKAIHYYIDFSNNALANKISKNYKNKNILYKVKDSFIMNLKFH